MKIIREGSLPENHIYKGTCGYCNTVFECTRGEGEFVSARDQRDSSYLKVKCPKCGRQANAYKKNDGAFIPQNIIPFGSPRWPVYDQREALFETQAERFGQR